MSEQTQMAGLVTTRPLSDALGAEVQGIDLRDLSPEQNQKILDAWHENLVVLIRNQTLSEEDQVRFGRLFGGGALSSGHIPALERVEGLVYVTNVKQPDRPDGILPDGEMQFHSITRQKARCCMPSRFRAKAAIRYSPTRTRRMKPCRRT
jgi:hypothetical protein